MDDKLDNNVETWFPETKFVYFTHKQSKLIGVSQPDN